VGFIDRDSPLGRLYTARKDRDQFYRQARFYSVEEVGSQIEKAGFDKPVASRTIFCSSDSITFQEQPIKSGHGEGSFVVLKATKTNINAAKPLAGEMRSGTDVLERRRP